MAERATAPAIRMVLALTLVTAIAATLLGVTDIFTRQPIRDAQRAMLRASLEQVLPEHANNPIDDVLHVHDGRRDIPVYIARDTAGRVKALAWEVVAPDGYAGAIRNLMGVTPNGPIAAIRVTEHQETPGLGDGIVHNRAWIDAFSGKTLANTRWAVKKDGGDFDQFTGATITPRAVVRAVHRGLAFFATHRKSLLRHATHLEQTDGKATLRP